jgi:CBS domain-containing protein
MIRENASMKSAEDEFRQEPIRSFCQREPATVLPSTTLAAALECLRGESGGCVVVVDKKGERQRPLGVLTERDYLDRLATEEAAAWASALQSPVEQFMTPVPRTIPESETLGAAVHLMTKGGYRNLPLVDSDGYLAGIVSARNITDYLSEVHASEVMNMPPRLHQDERIHSREGG